MKLIIIRHADPDYSIDSLTEKGWKEAGLLSERLKKISPDYIYCSPLGRAQDTAKPYIEKCGKEFTVCEWLREFDARTVDPVTGEKNRPWDQLPAVWTAFDEYYDKDKWLTHELMRTNVAEEYRWVCDELDKLLKKHGYSRDGMYYRVDRENTDTVVLFCHFGVECVLLSHIMNTSPMQLWHSFVALPSSVTLLNTEEREQGKAYFRCAYFGDISHLYVADEPPAFAARFCEVFSSEDRH